MRMSDEIAISPAGLLLLGSASEKKEKKRLGVSSRRVSRKMGTDERWHTEHELQMTSTCLQSTQQENERTTRSRRK